MRTFNCPRCGDASGCDEFGGIADRQVAERHPRLSKQGFRVCTPAWRLLGTGWKLGAFSDDYNQVRI